MMAPGSENPGACLKQSSDSSAIDDAIESKFSRRYCCFFTPGLFFTTSDSSNPTSSSSSSPGGRSSSSNRPRWHCWERVGGGSEDFVVVRAWNKMREWSEIVAGPRWKNFIRRMGRSANRPTGSRIGSGCQQQGKFGYDPLSYAMNFDEGRNTPSDEVDIGFRNFSSRYATMPSSAKSSMDLGKDGPSFL